MELMLGSRGNKRQRASQKAPRAKGGTPHHDQSPEFGLRLAAVAAAALAPAAAAGLGARQALEARAAQRQGGCRLLHDGGQARLRRKAGPQRRAVAGQGRPDRAQGADRRRGRQLRGRPAGRVRRGRARRRCQDHRLPLGGAAARHLRRATTSTRCRTSRASRSRCRRPIRCPTCWRASRWRNTASPSQVKLAAVGGDRERYQALVGGVVEGAVVSNEYQPEMPKTIHLLVAGRDAVPNFLRVCMITSGKVLKSAATTPCVSSPPRCRRCALRCRTRTRPWR